GPRDFASVSLDAGQKASVLAPPLADPHTLPSPATANSRETPDPVDALRTPTTYAEALEVLGANPDASLAAIKKIVDGLRQNWHPDRAKSDADRSYREARLQQINVAWDLVAQNRSAA